MIHVTIWLTDFYNGFEGYQWTKLSPLLQPWHPYELAKYSPSFTGAKELKKHSISLSI